MSRVDKINNSTNIQDASTIEQCEPRGWKVLRLGKEVN